MDRDVEDLDDEDLLITYYFRLGLSQTDMRTHMLLRHNIVITERTLKRKLKRLNLFRKKYFSPLDDLVEFLSKEIAKSGQNHGHKWMHLKCINNGFVVTQETVRLCLLELDNEGVLLRKKRRLKRREYISKGPNWNWHVDGYDKLVPYGLCISGCIDGYSRHIIWLKVGPTNKNSGVIHGYFLAAVEDCGGIPVTVRFDPGVENVEFRRTQDALAERYSSSNRIATICAKSTGNQRIESWWSILRKQNAQFWISFFQKLVHDGSFIGDWIDKGLVQFCFCELLQKELNQVVEVWNCHRIRSNKMSRGPSGKPINMYFTPEIYGTKNYINPVPEQEISNFKQVNCIYLDYPCEEDFFKLCQCIMEEESWEPAEEPDAAESLYLNLRGKIRPLLHDNGD